MHGTLFSVMWQPGWLGGEWIHTYMTESPCHSPVTITPLLFGHTPTQNKKLRFQNYEKFTFQSQRRAVPENVLNIGQLHSSLMLVRGYA